jgi:hypothetical protein
LVGVTLVRQSFLPVAFIVERGVRVWRLGKRHARPSGKHLSRYTVRRVFGRRRIDGRCFLRIGNGGGVLCQSARLAKKPPPPPPGLAERERWLDVDADNSVLYARRGQRVERVMLVSLSPKTPLGSYRIDSKHVSMTLHNQAHPDPWYLEQVPYVAFFHEGFALHAAYWHDEFGTSSTHGCVNLSPTDARWVFKFLRPSLPAGYVRINATESDPGTVVRVRRKSSGKKRAQRQIPRHSGEPATKK